MFIKLKASKGDPVYLNVNQIVSVKPARSDFDGGKLLAYWWVHTAGMAECGGLKISVSDADIKPLIKYLDFLNHRIEEGYRYFPEEYGEDRS